MEVVQTMARAFMQCGWTAVRFKLRGVAYSEGSFDEGRGETEDMLAVIREYKVPGGPDDIDFAPDGKLWITQRFAAKVAVLDPVTGAVQSIGVGRSPHGIYLSRSTRP